MKKTLKNYLRKGAISPGLLLITGFAVTLLIVNVSFIVFMSNDMRIYSTLINDTGKIRGGSQRVVKNELAQEASSNNANINDINHLLEKVSLIHRKLYVQLNAADEYSRQLDALINQWQLVSTQIQQVRAGTLEAKDLLASSEKLWYLADQAVAILEQAAHFDVLLYYIISLISTLTAILLMAVILATRLMIRRRTEYDLQHDPLTGLFNRHYLAQIASQELLLANRPDRSVYVLLCDIDHFRAINDSYGHEMGDRVIKAVAQLIEQQLHNPDLAARLSGETFVLLVHVPDISAAMEKGRKIRAEVEKLNVREGMNLTLSIGIARYGKGVGWEDALKNADLALYEAKHTGRNSQCVRGTEV